MREVSAPADLQSSADGTTSSDSSSVLDNTKKRKTLFNARENSLMVSASKVQVSEEKELFCSVMCIARFGS